MGSLLIFGLIVAAAWFFLSGSYKTSFKDPETLRDSELEDAFIELKKKILVTSAYEHEKSYEHLYYRIRDVFDQILQRHKHYVMDFDARGGNVSRIIMRRQNLPAHHSQYNNYIVPHDLNLKSVESDELLYLCFFLYLGGQVKNLGNVESDPQLMLKILDHLIDERKYPDAYFFKGLVMKYGSAVSKISKPSEARALFELAQKQGVGAASIELAQLGKYAQLEGIKSVHPNGN